jgi:uncharacterized membrane protein YcgQ (UPF0703/DUF1980 family)
MGNMNNWINRPDQAAQAQSKILRDTAISAYVYRVKDTDTGVGFSEELNDPSYLRTINARLDPPKFRGEEIDYVGLTDDTDVQKDDLWYVSNVQGTVIRYRVVNVVSLEDCSQAGLKIDGEEE